MREEMHKRIRDKLLYGIGQDDDLFQGFDQMMDESFSDSFMSIDSIGGSGPSLKMDWTETKIGRTLIVTPSDPQQKINLDVNNNLVTVSGEVKSETQNGVSMRSFSNSFPVPSDCEGSKVQISQKDGKLVMDFPFKTTSTKAPSPVMPERKSDGRIPLPPTGDEVSI
jgi:HSP20 family molecular chaperone IbpA